LPSALEFDFLSRDAKMSSQHTIVVIEDDPQLRRFLKSSLEAHNYRVILTETGQEGTAAIVANKPDLVLLDLILPDQTGASVLDRIRRWSRVPFIVLSCLGEARDKIELFERGANDYLVKPFDMGELLARIRVALRQSIISYGALPTIRNGSLIIDLVRKEITKAGQKISLSAREFDLISYLAINAGKVVTQQMILMELWGASHLEDTHYLRVFIARLRKKLENDPAHPKLITTVTGVGYRLNAAGAG
jgi:two-component system KDP operon response regulator KdpE